jgi:hypothetical protein
MAPPPPPFRKGLFVGLGVLVVRGRGRLLVLSSPAMNKKCGCASLVGMSMQAGGMQMGGG